MSLPTPREAAACLQEGEKMVLVFKSGRADGGIIASDFVSMLKGCDGLLKAAAKKLGFKVDIFVECERVGDEWRIVFMPRERAAKKRPRAPKR